MADKPSLEDLLRDIPPEKLDQPCSDDHLSEISLDITDWQFIAPFLELTEFEEREITCMYPNTLSMQNIGMLRKWKSAFAQNATYRTLISVLWKIGKTSLAEHVCTIVSDTDTSATARRHRRSTLDSYAEYLRGRYRTERPMFFTLQWPPPPTRKVFNLAMIEHKEIVQRGPSDAELVRLTLRGNADDIMRKKTGVKLENLFVLDEEKRKVILIEGAPGAGKSTLAWHICQKWESGELFQEFRVVVFVQLRDPVIQSATSLADILPARSSNMRKELQSAMEACDGRGVLFVLDGWDECGPGFQCGLLFWSLFCRPGDLNMHFSSLIITSRPIASGELQRYASSRVEIVGFTSAEVKKYFSESLGDTELERKLQDHLRVHPVIEASCYLPLNAVIVVHLFLALDHALPPTLHGVFLSLVVCCIIRHLTRQAEGGRETPHISSLDDLPPDLQEPFNNICTMAYHGVMENKATFSAADLKAFNLPTEMSTLSLIQGVESFTSFELSVSYHFLHLSIQELLAAFHISKLPAASQVQQFNDLIDERCGVSGRPPRLAAMFRFYAAFTKLQTEGVRDILAKIVQKRLKFVSLNLLHGLCEAQDISLCQFVASHLKGKLDLGGYALSPMDCLVVGYFLSCVCLTTGGEFEVDLSSCSLDDYRVSLLVKEIAKCSSSLNPLLILDLRRNDVSDRGAGHIAEIVCCLKMLDLSYCHVGDVKELAYGLEFNNSLKKLTIMCCPMSDQGVKSLARALERNSSLEELSLFKNGGVTSVGVMALGRSLKRNKGLKKLRLDGVCSVHDWERFISCLETNTHLMDLDLYIRDNEHEVLRQALLKVNRIRRENNLQELRCGGIHITDNEIEIFPEQSPVSQNLIDYGHCRLT